MKDEHRAVTFQSLKRSNQDPLVKGWLETSQDELDRLRRTRISKLVFPLAVLVVSLAYLYFSSPKHVVVSPTGDVKGVTNKMRAMVQGRLFWKRQLRKAEEELRFKEDMPEMMARIQKEGDEVYRRAEELLARVAPQSNASPLSKPRQEAAALRREADRIEGEEMSRFLDAIRIERIEELHLIIPVIKVRTQ